MNVTLLRKRIKLSKARGLRICGGERAVRLGGTVLDLQAGLQKGQ